MHILVIAGLLVIPTCLQAQVFPSISESEVARIEKTLASDDMQGRKAYTTGIEKAAEFIAEEFQKAGLKPLKGSKDYNQFFSIVDPESTEVTGSLNGESIDSKNIIVLTTDSSLSVTAADNYSKVYVKKGNNLEQVFFRYLDGNSNVLILVDPSFAVKFAQLGKIHMSQFGGSGNRILVLTDADPEQYSIRVKQRLKNQGLRNIIGMIPGKSKPDEYVIFSAHYDHLGIASPDATGDSIYNGANDDASGTTAVIALAKYFSGLNTNERSLIFAAFTAEEIGEFGSAYFSRQFKPEKIVAMLNIEMIGTESKWGRNSAYITGYDKSDLGRVLQKNLKDSRFRFYPDPYPEQMLFLRSDNAMLAKLGVPAHTVSTSKMDAEKYYHTRDDEISTLDFTNMTEIIRAIGLSTASIIAGKNTPTRVIVE